MHQLTVDAVNAAFDRVGGSKAVRALIAALGALLTERGENLHELLKEAVRRCCGDHPHNALVSAGDEMTTEIVDLVLRHLRAMLLQALTTEPLLRTPTGDLEEAHCRICQQYFWATSARSTCDVCCRKASTYVGSPHPSLPGSDHRYHGAFAPD